MSPGACLSRSPFLAMVLVMAMAAPSRASVPELSMQSSPRWHFALSLDDRRSDSATIVPRVASPGLKSEQTAFNYSLFGTLLPLPTLVLAVPGLWFGPSLGYFYAGRGGRAWSGIGIRTLAVGGMISSFGICGWDCGPGESAYNAAWAVFLTSGGVFVGSAIYDIATVKGDVRRQNESLTKTSWLISPEYRPGTRVIGLRLMCRF